MVFWYGSALTNSDHRPDRDGGIPAVEKYQNTPTGLNFYRRKSPPLYPSFSIQFYLVYCYFGVFVVEYHKDVVVFLYLFGQKLVPAGKLFSIRLPLKTFLVLLEFVLHILSLQKCNPWSFGTRSKCVALAQVTRRCSFWRMVRHPCGTS